MKFSLQKGQEGFSQQIYDLWGRTSQAVFAIAMAYFIYRLVDIVEFYLRRLTSKTQSQLDDMLVPMIRKTLRVFIAIISILFIADNVLEMQLKSILATAGIGGLAIALAAQETPVPIRRLDAVLAGSGTEAFAAARELRERGWCLRLMDEQPIDEMAEAARDSGALEALVVKEGRVCRVEDGQTIPLAEDAPPPSAGGGRDAAST